MALICPAFAARQWHSMRMPASSLPFGAPCAEIRASGEGRGLGLYTTRGITKFTQVVAESPLILMKPGDDLPELYAQFLQLDHTQRARYQDLGHAVNAERDAILAEKLRHRKLHEEFGEEGLQQIMKVASIMQTNAFNVDLHDGQGSNHRALFPTIARINHSCMPNAHVCFYPGSAGSSRRGRMYVHTLRVLEPGEEVLISYFDILLPRDQRQAKTTKWGFECRCAVCVEDPSVVNGVSLEDQRKYLREWLTLQEQCMRSSSLTAEQVQAVLSMGETLVENAQVNASLTPAFPKMLDGLAMVQAKLLAMQNRITDRGQILSFLERAIVWEANITGPESHAVTERVEKLEEFAKGHRGSRHAKLEQDDNGAYRVVWS